MEYVRHRLPHGGERDDGGGRKRKVHCRSGGGDDQLGLPLARGTKIRQAPPRSEHHLVDPAAAAPNGHAMPQLMGHDAHKENRQSEQRRPGVAIAGCAGAEMQHGCGEHQKCDVETHLDVGPASEGNIPTQHVSHGSITT